MICVKLFFRPNSKLSQKPTQYLTLVIWVRVIGDAHITRVAQLRGVSISLWHGGSKKWKEKKTNSSHYHVSTVAYRYRDWEIAIAVRCFWPNRNLCLSCFYVRGRGGGDERRGKDSEREQCMSQVPVTQVVTRVVTSLSRLVPVPGSTVRRVRRHIGLRCGKTRKICLLFRGNRSD